MVAVVSVCLILPVVKDTNWMGRDSSKGQKKAGSIFFIINILLAELIPVQRTVCVWGCRHYQDLIDCLMWNSRKLRVKLKGHRRTLTS